MVSFPLFLWISHFWETVLNIADGWGRGMGVLRPFPCGCQLAIQLNAYCFMDIYQWSLGKKKSRYLVAVKEIDSLQMSSYSQQISGNAYIDWSRPVAHQSILQHVLHCCLLYTNYWSGPYRPALIYIYIYICGCLFSPQCFVFIRFLNFKRSIVIVPQSNC